MPRMNPSGRISIKVEIENRYFDHFQRKTASGFQDIMDWTIWNHLVLQLCHQESFVRDSVIAIGALIRSLEVHKSSKKLFARPEESIGVANMHRQFALLKYSSAVKAMQGLAHAGPRDLLISCLLVFCFEILLNSRTSALPQLLTGHRMLQEFLSKHHRTALIDRGIHSPEPATIDDELVEAFERLDLQISTIYDVRPIEMHRAIIDNGRDVIQHMPSTFDTLTDAGKCLIIVMKQSHHFLATAWHSTQPEALVAEFVNKPPGPLSVVSGVNSNSTSYIVPDFLRMEQKRYANDLIHWSQAFEPLFQQFEHLEKSDIKTQIASRLLKVQAIATGILIAGVLITEEIDYDRFLPQFEEMITLLSIIIDAHQKAPDENIFSTAGFVLGLGLSAPLFTLVMRCRDRAIRRKGIEILEGWHQEACWDPLVIAEIGKYIVEVEEAGVPEGVIPESSRAVITRICEGPVDGSGIQCALIQLVQRRGGENGGPVWKERMIYSGRRRGPA